MPEIPGLPLIQDVAGMLWDAHDRAKQSHTSPDAAPEVSTEGPRIFIDPKYTSSDSPIQIQAREPYNFHLILRELRIPESRIKRTTVKVLSSSNTHMNIATDPISDYIVNEDDTEEIRIYPDVFRARARAVAQAVKVVDGEIKNKRIVLESKHRDQWQGLKAIIPADDPMLARPNNIEIALSAAFIQEARKAADRMRRTTLQAAKRVEYTVENLGGFVGFSEDLAVVLFHQHPNPALQYIGMVGQFLFYYGAISWIVQKSNQLTHAFSPYSQRVAQRAAEQVQGPSFLPLFHVETQADVSENLLPETFIERETPASNLAKSIVDREVERRVKRGQLKAEDESSIDGLFAKLQGLKSHRGMAGKLFSHPIAAVLRTFGSDYLKPIVEDPFEQVLFLEEQYKQAKDGEIERGVDYTLRKVNGQLELEVRIPEVEEKTNGKYLVLRKVNGEAQQTEVSVKKKLRRRLSQMKGSVPVVGQLIGGPSIVIPKETYTIRLGKAAGYTGTLEYERESDKTTAVIYKRPMERPMKHRRQLKGSQTDFYQYNYIAYAYALGDDRPGNPQRILILKGDE